MTVAQAPGRIQVTVCHVTAQCLTEVTLALEPSATVQDALTQARVNNVQFGMLIDQAVAIGVFGKRAELSAVVCDGDRLELYRSLVVEPKVARRRRAAHRHKVRQTKNKVPIADRTV